MSRDRGRGLAAVSPATNRTRIDHIRPAQLEPRCRGSGAVAGGRRLSRDCSLRAASLSRIARCGRRRCRGIARCGRRRCRGIARCVDEPSCCGIRRRNRRRRSLPMPPPACRALPRGIRLPRRASTAGARCVASRHVRSLAHALPSSCWSRKSRPPARLGRDANTWLGVEDERVWLGTGRPRRRQRRYPAATLHQGGPIGESPPDIGHNEVVRIFDTTIIDPWLDIAWQARGTDLHCTAGAPPVARVDGEPPSDRRCCDPDHRRHRADRQHLDRR